MDLQEETADDEPCWLLSVFIHLNLVIIFYFLSIH